MFSKQLNGKCQILLEKRLSGVAELVYIMLYGKSQLNTFVRNNEKLYMDNNRNFPAVRLQPERINPTQYTGISS
jgi:hypothetical protein